MIRNLKLIIPLVIVSFAVGCNGTTTIPQPVSVQVELDSTESELFEAVVGKNGLHAGGIPNNVNPWEGGEAAYDRGHDWQVPLHLAFLGNVSTVVDPKSQNQSESWKKRFTNTFSYMVRYLKAPSTSISGKTNLDVWRGPVMPTPKEENAQSGTLLNRIQFLWMVSRLVVLVKQTGSFQLESESTLREEVDLIEKFLVNEVDYFWNVENYFLWGNEEPWIRQNYASYYDIRGMKVRIDWLIKENQQANDTSTYYKTINDKELFLFAIAADLETSHRLTNRNAPTIIGQILDKAKLLILNTNVMQPKGDGLLVQENVLSTNPEYLYGDVETGFLKRNFPKECTDSFPSVLNPKCLQLPARNWDTLHSQRLPLIFTSLLNAYPPNSETRKRYHELRVRLEKQFMTQILVKPSADFAAYRTNNFIDGKNGMYRWQYGKQPRYGIGSFESSDTLMTGLWVFLNTERVQDMYVQQRKNVYDSFTAGGYLDVVQVYDGEFIYKTLPMDSSNAPHFDRNSIAGKNWELLVKLAAKKPVGSLDTQR
jgi:hypothetical protein